MGLLLSDIPTVAFDLEGQNSVIKLAEAFFHGMDEDGKRYFCLMFTPAEHDSTLGAPQHTNYRMVFDLKNKLLHFKSENC